MELPVQYNGPADAGTIGQTEKVRAVLRSAKSPFAEGCAVDIVVDGYRYPEPSAEQLGQRQPGKTGEGVGGLGYRSGRGITGAGEGDPRRLDSGKLPGQFSLVTLTWWARPSMPMWVSFSS